MERTPSYRRIYVLGAHKLALSYVEKIRRAAAQGRIAYEKLFSVSDTPAPEAETLLSEGDLIRESPACFLAETAFSETDPTRDTVVPDHTAKHVLLQAWLHRIATRFPRWRAALAPLPQGPAAPFLNKFENEALWAASHATWTCPPDCDEPSVCPHLKAPRDWDLFRTLAAALPRDKDSSLHVFGCEPLIDEIAHIPLEKITSEWRAFADRLETDPPRRVIIATHSHCHGIIGHFELN